MNMVVLIGRLTRDPETRYYSEDQKAVTTFTIAVDRPFSRDRNAADFLRIVVYGKQAENCSRYLTKGSQVGVQGRIQTGSYETKTGEKRYTTDIVADRVEFLQRAGAGAGAGGRGEGDYMPGGMGQDPFPGGGSPGPGGYDDGSGRYGGGSSGSYSGQKDFSGRDDQSSGGKVQSHDAGSIPDGFQFYGGDEPGLENEEDLPF